MNIVVTSLPFWRANRGALQRVLAQIKTLQSNVPVKVCYIGKINYFDYRALARHKLSNIVESIYDFTPTSAHMKIGELPRSLRQSVSNDAASRFERYASFNRNATFIFHNIDLHYLKRCLRDNQVSILDMHDIRSNRVDGFKKAGRIPETLISREAELNVFNEYEFLIAIQNVDKNDLISWGVDESKIITCGHTATIDNHYSDDDVSHIGYMGSHNISNVDSIRWFIRNVWPAYESSNVFLNIYGDVCKHLSGLDQFNVRLHGLVPNVEKVYQDNQLIINPVLYGSGLKIKNIESMAMGRPLITTDEGARGIENEKNRSYLLANTPYEFIEAIECLSYSTDLRRSLVSNGLDFIEKNYSDEASYSELLDLISDKHNAQNF